jgi:hypothetical protein
MDNYEERNAIINTPGQIRADMDTVRGLIRQLDADVQGSKASTQFKAAWKGFVDEFEGYYRSNSGWGAWWFGAKEKTDEYRRRVRDWRTMFVAEGGKPTTPEDRPPDPSSSGGGWKVAALGIGAAFVGALALGWAASRPRAVERTREEL